MATYNEIFAEVQDIVNTTAATDYIPTALLHTQRRIYRNLRAPINYRLKTDVVSATYDFPVFEDFLEMEKMNYKNHILKEISYEDMLQQHENPDSRDFNYSSYGTVWVFPVGLIGQTIKVWYYAELELISSSNPQNAFSIKAPDLLVYSTAMEVFRYMKNDGELKRYESFLSTAWQDFNTLTSSAMWKSRKGPFPSGSDFAISTRNR